MERVGGSVVDALRERTEWALDAHDRPMEPLSKQYKRRKQRKGGNPIRDLRMTGRTMRALRVEEATEDEFTVGFGGDNTAKKRADFQHLFHGFFGVSLADARAIDRTIDAVHEEIVENAVEGRRPR